jgi:serine/threonine protein kinase
MAERTVQQYGNYRLLHLLGRGGFADVYLGSHIHLERQVAVKVLRPQLVEEQSERFRMEARTIARLEHPHIVHILDFDVQDGTPFLVMNYIPNGTLRRRHPRGARLPLSTVVSYVQQTASALQYAHEQRVIHRDIKPENLLVGRNQEIVLSDFGIAMIMQNSLPLRKSEMAGTIAYMAPEQIEGRPEASSDQYALAVLTYEWLSGERPFNGTFAEIASKKCVMSAPPLRDKLPYISPAVEEVVMTALAKDPKDRFVTVQAFATALEHFARNSDTGQIQTLPVGQPPFTPIVSSPPEMMGFVPVAVQGGAMTTPVLRSPSIADAGQQETSSGGRMEPVSLSKPLQTQTVAQPSRHRITRRTVVISTLGLVVAVGGIGMMALNWMSSSHQSSPANSNVAASPSPNSIPSSVLDQSINSSQAMFGFDLQRTHFNPVEQALSPNTVPHLVPYWNAQTGGVINSSPVVADGVVYVGSDDGNLYALNSTNGTKLWAFSTGKKIISSPAVTRSAVYVGSEDSKFYAINISTGTLYWPPFLTGGRIDSSPVVANGVVYVGSNDESLYAIDASTGKEFWAPFTDYPVISSPAISDGRVYFGSQNGWLYAFDAITGKPVWQYQMGSIDNSSPAVANGVVYIGCIMGFMPLMHLLVIRFGTWSLAA